MASQQEQDYLIGVTLTRDDAFRAWLVRDPRAAAKSVGVELTDREVQYISSMNVDALNKAAAYIQETLPPRNTHWGE